MIPTSAKFTSRKTHTQPGKKINAVTGGDIARPLSLLILKLTEGKDDPDKLEQSICNLLHRIPKLTIRANQ